jgi:tryptophanyl-tRNA synthetase
MDGMKMGKSYGNDIKIADTADETIKKVRTMVTDRTRIAKADPGHVDLCEVPWPWYRALADKDYLAIVKDECESAKIGCVDCKKRLGGLINDRFHEFREKRISLAKEPEKVFKILDYGNSKARKVASQTLSEMRERMGMIDWNDSQKTWSRLMAETV